MRLVRHNVRLPVSLDNTLRSLAKHQGTSAYAVLQQCVQTGIAALAQAPAAGTTDQEIVGELASLGTRIVDVERLLDRTLFTACAAYASARSAVPAQARATRSSPPRPMRRMTASGGSGRSTDPDP